MSNKRKNDWMLKEFYMKRSTSDDSIMKQLVGIALVWALVVCSIVVRSAVMHILYQWYARPIGFPDLNGLYLYGIAGFIQYAIGSGAYAHSETNTETTEGNGKIAIPVIKMLFKAALVVFWGWIVAKAAGLPV